MPVTVRSYAKINLGLYIGPRRADGFHDLRTVYQTIALHDVLRVEIVRGTGIEIRSKDPRVPCDATNTCYRIAERVIEALKARGKVIIEIEKRLPVQGGLGGASGNAVATLLALERALKKQLSGAEKLRIAAEVGSDLPLFLIGGTSLGVGRGEEVYPLPDFPSIPCVIATPQIGVSTPKAFADWDALVETSKGRTPKKLTLSDPSDRINTFSRVISAWLSGSQLKTGKAVSGVPVSNGRGRAETLLLDLVRTGIENDFEQVVFPQYPALREVKSAIKKSGAYYASLSGSGSALYGLFTTRKAAEKAAVRLNKSGVPAVATSTLTRRQYWKRF
ncbi:MAG TPA: 4-(cytidine 5'-diphospho)-2-C-methyl-D-erythritol kinase [Terriglobales bacterium]|jgi:4-diphosphocytidyl-2-C-methyl-D-erythritol kinase